MDLVKCLLILKKFQWFLNPVDVAKCFSLFSKIVLTFPSGFENIVKYLNSCLSNSSSLITIALLGVYKQSAPLSGGKWQLSLYFKVENESTVKLRKNVEYI